MVGSHFSCNRQVFDLHVTEVHKIGAMETK